MPVVGISEGQPSNTPFNSAISEMTVSTSDSELQITSPTLGACHSEKKRHSRRSSDLQKQSLEKTTDDEDEDNEDDEFVHIDSDDLTEDDDEGVSHANGSLDFIFLV